jgi:N-acetylglutamate synthase-like GNAT family acetyltransferase
LRVGSKSCWTGDLLEIHRRIVSIFEPIESPEATRFEGGWQFVAVRSCLHTSIAISPRVWTRKLTRAAIEETNTTTGHLNVKVVFAKVTASIGYLYDQFFTNNGT